MIPSLLAVDVARRETSEPQTERGTNRPGDDPREAGLQHPPILLRHPLDSPRRLFRIFSFSSNLQRP